MSICRIEDVKEDRKCKKGNVPLLGEGESVNAICNITYLVQLTAGIAYLLSRACCKSFMRLSPVTTPGGTISVILVMFLMFVSSTMN